MVWLIYHHVEHQHGVPHARFASSPSLTLGFSALACFNAGYIWLILRVAGQNDAGFKAATRAVRAILKKG